MRASTLRQINFGFSPDLVGEDALAAYWVRQAVVRLRREIAWLWHQRNGTPAPGPGHLPAMGDRLLESLDLARYSEAKNDFFARDATASYLTQQLEAPAPRYDTPARGSFGWVVDVLGLDDVSSFALALGLLDAVDAAAGPVLAACHNDPSSHHPTLALVQRLWDEPEAVLALGDPGHPLRRLGLLQFAKSTASRPYVLDWEEPFSVAPVVAAQLLFPGRGLPDAFAPVAEENETDDPGHAHDALVGRLRALPTDRLHVVPVVGTKVEACLEASRAVGRSAGLDVRRLTVEASGTEQAAHLSAMLAVAWLRGVSVFVADAPGHSHGAEHPRLAQTLAALRTIPAVAFLSVSGPDEVAPIPSDHVLPVLEPAQVGYTERVQAWRRYLGPRAHALDDAIEEASRRFRFDRATVRSICAALNANGAPPTANDLFEACRAESPLDSGGLAQRVAPRFTEEELVLPPDQWRQFQEIYRAMKALTEVHYRWGTGRAWNESGISVLFAGPPGTGKTMAAEVLAAKLDMPMYRIDLSQVVNKYIGETEKNLKRLFDFADIADTILFFDEADALFGRRTEVKDAHDRYANLEVSYLLERMERFKGLAVLATNRRRDLDDAFARRLRYIVEFPLPDEPRRRELWTRMLPKAADTSQVDVAFLARQFPLAGGSIRSIVFNACLQAAYQKVADGPVLTMEQVIVAVKREYDKLGRAVALDQFGPYASIVEGLERG